jgi:class 3 adenylate cyclase/DNA-binding NarL/FixJ family response regulator
MTSSRLDVSPNVLLVDPCGYQQSKLLELLAHHGVTVTIVGTVPDAWAVMEQHPPHLLLLETTLPHDAGVQMCKRLQRLHHTQAIPVMFWSDRENQHDRLRGFEAGGVDFIQKPYSAAEVMARIRVHIAYPPRSRVTDAILKRPSMTPRDIPLLVNLQKRLHQQTVKLQEQNVRLELEIRERHEIEQALRKEQQKSEQLLLNILPEAIVTQLKQFQGSLAERFEEATVLFADIVDFTPLATQSSPLQLVNLLNQIFSAFDRLAETHQLEKIKTIGDAYMVVGGVPVSLEQHAIAVADMALAMQAVIRRFAREDDTPLQLRIGINTGTVVAGVIGIKKFSYDLWGDTVNVASRMESQGQPGKIQVTESTYIRLQSLFHFEPAGEIDVKGKGLMRTFYLLGRR